MLVIRTELIDPAVKGTLNVLKSCAKVPSIKRVVITASIVSVLYNEKPLTSNTVVDETWFSDSHFCQKNKHWYMASKTLAEEAAWKFAKENGIDLVVLNPGFMFGPLLQPALNSTSQVVLGFTKGENTFSSSTYWLVDVRDILHTLNELYPTLGLQAKCEDYDKPLEPIFKYVFSFMCRYRFCNPGLGD
ncbi:hypothetical protein V6N13_146412 [Hibiscus sabdariffa]